MNSKYENMSLKDTIRNEIKNIIGSDVFHLEQVYTLGETKFYNTGVNVIYLGITNVENIKKLGVNIFSKKLIEDSKEGLVRHSSNRVARAVCYWFKKQQKQTSFWGR